MFERARLPSSERSRRSPRLSIICGVISWAFGLMPGWGQGYQVLHSFTGSDGASPMTGLTLSGTFVYGSTFVGGISNCGTLFKMGTDGKGYTVLKEFLGPDGQQPLATLVIADQTIYGTTHAGGNPGDSFGYGTIFRIGTDGSGFTVLRKFSGGAEGYCPATGLALADGVLYGTTYNTLYKVNTDGTGYTVIKTFWGGTEGGEPQGLIVAGWMLYGTAYWGGPSSGGGGTVFSIGVDGTGFRVLKGFGWADSEGSTPQGVALVGNSLYGTTSRGGLLGGGTLYRMNTDGSGFTVLKQFGGLDGEFPCAFLGSSGNLLWGTTDYGGVYNCGTVFQVNTNGSDFTVLKHLNVFDGAHPWTAVSVLPGPVVYGTTMSGGSFDKGVVFALPLPLTPSVTAPPVNQTVNEGARAELLVCAAGSPMLAYQWLFGGSSLPGASASVLALDPVRAIDAGAYSVIVTNSYGSVTSAPAILSVLPSPTFSVLHSFPLSSTNGSDPAGALAFSGTELYGLCTSGGDSYDGAVFQIGTNGGGFSLLKSFVDRTDGRNPIGGLLQSGTKFFGTTGSGPGTNRGTVFKMNLDGTGFSVLKIFPGISSNDAAPRGGLTLNGSTLYGSTVGWGSPSLTFGLIYALDTNGNSYRVLKEFRFSDGSAPVGSLIVEGPWLYGVTQNGGVPHSDNQNGDGVLFRIQTNGTDYQVLKYFSRPDLCFPGGGLVLKGSTLYGTAEYGGAFSAGGLFRINTDGSGFAAVKSFAGPPDGLGPAEGLVLAANTLYGTTMGGGGSRYYGTFYEINLAGAGYSVLKQFTGGEDGAYPRTPLLLVGGNLYGCTAWFGSSPSGVLFSQTVPPPRVLSVPSSRTVEVGDGVTLPVSEIGAFDCQWYLNGTSVPGQTNATLEFPAAQLSHSGAYYLVLSNASGFAASSKVSLSVIPRISRQIVTGFRLTSDPGVFLNLDRSTTPGLSASWTTFAGVALVASPQWYFDLSAPDAAQQYFRAWHTNTQSPAPGLALQLVPALTLSGTPGTTLRLEYINPIGPVDAWVALDAVRLTNSPQLYFDISAAGRPARLYRVTAAP